MRVRSRRWEKAPRQVARKGAGGRTAMKASVAGAPYASNMKPASTSTRAVPQSCGLPGRERQCQATGTRQGAQQAGVTHLGCAERVQLALCVGQPRAQRPRDVSKHILQPRIRLQQHACRQSAPPGEARQREGRARHREGTQGTGPLGGQGGPRARATPAVTTNRLSPTFLEVPVRSNGSGGGGVHC